MVRRRRLLQLLRKRLRQLLRVTLVLAICLAVAAAALAIWWLTSLNGLPDIGDPFDVAAFRAFRVPDDQNAFTFLRRADEKLTPSPSQRRRSPGLRRIRSCGSGSRRIARRSNCFSRGPNNPTPRTRPENPVVNGQRLTVLALLEGEQATREWRHGGRLGLLSRGPPHDNSHQAAGELGSAFRRSTHIGTAWLRQRLATWAADPRTTIPQLHGALDEVLKSEPRPEWDSFAIKAGYLEMMRSLEQPVRSRHPAGDRVGI